MCIKYKGFPGGSVVKNQPVSVGDTGSIPGSGRSPGKGHGNPLKYSCLENPMDRGVWCTTVQRVAESDTAEATEHACICYISNISFLKARKSIEFFRQHSYNLDKLFIFDIAFILEELQENLDK